MTLVTIGSALPTLRTLLGTPRLGLRLISDPGSFTEAAMDRAVRWIHSTDLEDPTPFLSDDLVLLTTGRQFLDVDATPRTAEPVGSAPLDTGASENQAQRGDPEGSAMGSEAALRYVERLQHRGVIALGFGVNVVRGSVPSELVEACARFEMPLFEVPYRTPFIAVARVHSEAIAAANFSRRSWALDAQRAISLAALRPDGLSATLAELAKQLGTWVGLFDRSGALTHDHQAPPGSDDAVGRSLPAAVRAELNRVVTELLAKGARAALSTDIEGTAFTIQTLGRGGELRGALAIAVGGLDQDSRGVVTTVVAMSGLALEQRRSLARAQQALRRAVALLLADGHITLARRIAREVWGPLPSGPLIVALTEPNPSRSRAIAEYLDQLSTEQHGQLFFAGLEEGFLVIASQTQPDLLATLAERFSLRAGYTLRTGYDGLADAVEQARSARERGSGTVTAFSDVSAGGILGALGQDAPAIAGETLRPLLAYDAAHGTALTATLRTWLAHDCASEPTAKALGIHRHTLRSRISLAESTLGRNLASFADRAELWLSLELLGE